MKFKLLSAITLLVLLAAALISCGDEPNPIQEKDIDGIIYKLSEDGAYYTVCGVSDKRAYSISIKEEIDGVPVTEIKKEAFKNNTSITKLTLPKSISAIGENAFYGCHKLIEVYNLSDLKIVKNEENGCVGKYAINIYASQKDGYQRVTDDGFLYYLSADKSLLLGYLGKERAITLPQNIEGVEYEIYDYAFAFYDGSYEINIPSGALISKIGKRAFYRSTALKSLDLPSCLTEIGMSAFDGCTGIDKVTMGNNVTELGDFAFNGCTKLEAITLSSTLTSIGEFAFQGCESLKEIRIPEKVTQIDACAFRWCFNLEKAYLPSTQKVLGKKVFDDCHSLTLYLETNKYSSWGRDWNPDNRPLVFDSSLFD